MQLQAEPERWTQALANLRSGRPGVEVEELARAVVRRTVEAGEITDR